MRMNAGSEFFSVLFPLQFKFRRVSFSFGRLNVLPTPDFIYCGDVFLRIAKAYFF